MLVLIFNCKKQRQRNPALLSEMKKFIFLLLSAAALLVTAVPSSLRGQRVAFENGVAARPDRRHAALSCKALARELRAAHRREDAAALQAKLLKCKQERG